MFRSPNAQIAQCPDRLISQSDFIETNVMSRTILVTGASGQIGSDLIIALRKRYGAMHAIASSRRPLRFASKKLLPYVTLDVTDKERLQRIVEQYRVGTIYHLAGLLSATGERHRDRCWDVNINGLRNVLETAKTYQLQVFWPSSIAVFGPNAPKFETPQRTIKDPSTLYGITKVTGELLCQYYAQRFDLDVRSLRFPGIISHRAAPGGGTTDFAVEIFVSALKYGIYTCFVRPETRLPMMYMPDAINAMLMLMQADPASIAIRSSYNIAAVSFSAAELVTEIQRYLPDFKCRYAPDFRQTIADSWPATIDDAQARQDWDWQPRYDLPGLVKDMLENLSQQGAGSTQPIRQGFLASV